MDKLLSGAICVPWKVSAAFRELHSTAPGPLMQPKEFQLDPFKVR